MELSTEFGIDLFGEEPLSLEQIKRLADYIHSSERNEIAFAEQLDANADKTGQKAALAAGIGLYFMGRDAEAVVKLKKAKDCKEKLLHLAYAFRRMGLFEQAIKSLDNSLAFEGDPLSVNLEKCATYRCAGDSQAGHKELKNCANYENVSAEYHYQLARLQEGQGLYEQAIENYQKAVELAPEHKEAVFHLARRCDLAGDDEAAMDYYKQLVAKVPAPVNALLNLAVMHEDMGEFGKAVDCVDRALSGHPNHERARLFKKDVESSQTMYYDEEKERKNDRRTQILETPISDFELSVRSRNCFKKMGIHTLGDLMHITEPELLSYKNFGETSLREIKIILESKGLNLGMALEDNQADSVEADDQAEQDAMRELLNKTVDELNLTVRARRCLQKLEIHTLSELTQKTDAELLGCKNFGVTSLNEIKKALANAGLSLRTLD
jgi:DNA-directed RNA polymerase subunit alpha